MEMSNVKVGLKVTTCTELHKKHRLSVLKRYLKARTPNAEGVVTSYVPGHGGDAWFILHPDGSIGAYMTDEFDPCPEATT